MAEQLKSKKKLLYLLAGVVVAAGIAVALVLILGKTKSELAKKLEADGTATISVDGDVTVDDILYVNGDKTLVGSGRIIADSSMEYVIVINSDAKLTLEGPTVDGNQKATNGIYTSENATFNLNDGSVENVPGHGVRVLGTSAVAGGGVKDVGTNWYMVDENASLEVTGGTLSNSGEAGVLTGAGSTLSISKNATLDTSLSNLIYSSGTADIDGGSFKGNIDYAFFNAGVMNIKNVAFTGAKALGYIENEEGGKMNLDNVKMLDSKSDFIYNKGIFTAKKLTLGTCVNSAIENTGTKAKVTLTDVTAGKIGASFLLNRQSISTLENVKVEKVGAYMVFNRAAYLTAKNVEVEEVGGTAYLNDFRQAKATTGCGDMTLENFKVGKATGNGLRSNGGNIKLTNGEFGVCDNHGMYLKDGKLTCVDVNFGGSAPGRAVVQVGYKNTTNAKVTFENTNITGGGRGLANYDDCVWTGGSVHDISTSGTNKVGAGIRNGGDMVIKSVDVYGCHALSSGGAVYNDANLTIEGGTYRNNTSATSGGGIANSKKGTMTIVNAYVSGNRATNYAGGVYSSGKITVKGGTYTGNYSVKGGGGLENTGICAITGGLFTNNTSGGVGAGVYNGSKGTMTLGKVKIDSNYTRDDKSTAGFYNLGTATVNGATITNNVSGTYAGGLSNGISSDGTKIGKMVINDCYISGNTATHNGGGGVYNRGIMTINGGTVEGNNLGDKDPSTGLPIKNGKNVYNSGTLTLNGGSMRDLPTVDYDNAPKPYDIYSYKGNVIFKGSPNVGSIYKAADSLCTIENGFSAPNRIGFYMTSYKFLDRAFAGSYSAISAGKHFFNLEHHDVSTTSENAKKYVGNDGYIVAPYAPEAELWRNGEKLITTYFSNVAEAAADGDEIVIIGDITITDYTPLTCFSKSVLDMHKSIKISGDGNPHTLTIATGQDAGFYMAASAGDGGTGTSDSGYYRSSIDIDFDATNLTFEGIEDMGSAAVFVSGPVNLNLKNGTFKNFTNVALEANDLTHSTGKNGAAFSIGGASKVTIDGTKFIDNSNVGSGGAAIYNNGYINVKNAVFEGNNANGKNGGAIYFTSTGKGDITNCTFNNNTATNAGAIYVYGGGDKVVVNNSTFTDNTATGESDTTTQAIYATFIEDKDDNGNITRSVYGHLVLNGVTVNGGEGTKQIMVREKNKLSLGGNNKIDQLVKGAGIVINATSAITGDIKLIVDPVDYFPGNQILDGSTTGAGSAITVNTGELTIDDGGVLRGELANVVELDGVGYPSFDLALVDSQTKEKATIKLIANATQGNPANADNIFNDLTIDLNGYTLDASHQRSALQIAPGATVTIKDSSGDDSGVFMNTKCSNSGAIGTIQGTLNIEGGTFIGQTTGSNGGAFRVWKTGTINMSGGIIKDSSAGIGAAMYIGGSGNTAIVNITGGEIKDCAGGDGSDIFCTTTGTVLNISGEAKIAANIVEDPATSPEVVITGGYFAQEVDPAPGYVCVEDTTYPEYPFKVIVSTYVAKIGTTGYETLEAAVEAANALPDAKIEMQKDVTVTSQIDITGPDVTIDLNGKTIEGTFDSDVAIFNVDEGAKLSIVDTAKVIGKITSNKYSVFVSGTFVISSGEIASGEFGSMSSSSSTIIKGTARIAVEFDATNISIMGGYFTKEVTPAVGYKCVADTSIPGYSYKVESNVQGVDVEPMDPFE